MFDKIHVESHNFINSYISMQELFNSTLGVTPSVSPGLGGQPSSQIANLTSSVLDAIQKTFKGVNITQVDMGPDELKELFDDPKTFTIFNDITILVNDTSSAAKVKVGDEAAFDVDLSEGTPVFNPQDLSVSLNNASIEETLRKNIETAIMDQALICEHEGKCQHNEGE